jgi:hypothetical protein
LTDEELRAIAVERDLARQLSDVKPSGETAPPANDSME